VTPKLLLEFFPYSLLFLLKLSGIDVLGEQASAQAHETDYSLNRLSFLNVEVLARAHRSTPSLGVA